MIITIDGPTASGKSSAAAALAKRLGFYYLSTGFLYRSLTYLLLNVRGYSPDDLYDVKQQDIDACGNPAWFTYTYDAATGYAIIYKGLNITPFLKDSLIDTYVAVISPQKLVREAMVAQQRFLAAQHDIVVDGRDVGSHVFPHADYKFYLTALLTVRAARWQKDQQKRGHSFTLQECQERVHTRDRSDEERKISPLVIPVGAVVIDNSELSLPETVEKMMTYIEVEK